MSLGDRFWEKVAPDGESPGGCWLWTSALDKGGYPVFWVDGRRRAARAQRLIFEDLRGPIPPGLTLDHLCRVRACVNPAHMDPCTSGDNAARSPLAPYNVKARQTACKRGHAFNAENTGRHNGRRECRACNAARARRRRAA